jgi:hypothetical protein
MKTMKKEFIGATIDVIRVRDREAKRYLAQGYTFCPKAEWKKLQPKPKQGVIK